MHEIEKSEKKCFLYNFLFLKFTSSNLFELLICSYNYIKHFVNEVFAKLKSFQIKQRKIKFEKDEKLGRVRNPVANRSERMTRAITSSSLSSTKSAFLCQRLALSLPPSRL